MHLQSPPRLNAPAARAGLNEARDAAPTPQLQSAQTLHPPRNPRSQPRMTRQSLPKPTAGLEAIHHNSIQGTVHETLTLGCSTQEAAYSAILRDDITEAEHEAMTHR